MTHLIIKIVTCYIILCIHIYVVSFLQHILYKIYLQYTTIEHYFVPLYLHQFVVQKTYPILARVSLPAEKLA